MKTKLISILFLTTTSVFASDSFVNFNQNGQDISKPKVVFFDTNDSYNPMINQNLPSDAYGQYVALSNMITPPTTIDIDLQALQQEIKDLSENVSSTKYTKTTITTRLATPVSVTSIDKILHK